MPAVTWFGFAVGDDAVPGKLSASPQIRGHIPCMYVCVPGANQYASASSREMFGSNAYVSPAATTSWKMFQIASRSASVAGRIFTIAKEIVGQPLRLPQSHQLSERNNATSAAKLLFYAPRSPNGAVSVRAQLPCQPDFTRNARPTVCAFIILFETSLGPSLAIPGWEQTSIAEAFLSRTGRNTDFPVDVTIRMSVTFPCPSKVKRKRPVPVCPGRDWPGGNDGAGA